MNDGWIKKVRCSKELEDEITQVLEEIQIPYPQFIKEAVEAHINSIKNPTPIRQEQRECQTGFPVIANTKEEAAEVVRHIKQAKLASSTQSINTFFK